MYDRAPNSLERLEMTYRYFHDHSDPWENSMIGNCKNSDWERKALIRETKREDSKIYLGSLRIPSATLPIKLIDGCSLHPNYSPMEPFSTLPASSITGNRFQTIIKKLTMF